MLQVDHNPIEWPPRHVLEPLDNAEDADLMISCIENVKKWIKENHSIDRGKGPDPLVRLSDESPYAPQNNPSLDSDLTRYIHSLVFLPSKSKTPDIRLNIVAMILTITPTSSFCTGDCLLLPSIPAPSLSSHLFRIIRQLHKSLVVRILLSTTMNIPGHQNTHLCICPISHQLL